MPFVEHVVYLSIPTSNHNKEDTWYELKELYIFRFLHQTTTMLCKCLNILGCISFDSYIKPQHNVFRLHQQEVVYLSIPTSNHNADIARLTDKGLYIFRFLHQTTTQLKPLLQVLSCISFDSYIKPQPVALILSSKGVVYLSIPTSNHNGMPTSY